MSPLRKLLLLLAAAATLLGVLALPASARSTKAPATSVHITSGTGTEAHSYQFKVIKNKNGVVVLEIVRRYRTIVGDTFTITERTTMSNTTTEHWDGDHSVTKMYTKFLFGCSGQSYDVPVKCQRVSFYPQQHLVDKSFRGGEETKLGTPVSCASTGNSMCHTTKWITRYGWRWNVDGGMWSSDYKFPKWQASIALLRVEINGHWIKHDDAAFVPWAQATLNT